MALALAVQKVNVDMREKEIVLKATASGNYATGGDTVNLTTITNPNFKTNAVFGFPGDINEYEVLSCPTGYVAELIPGATLATWKLKFSATGAALSGALGEIAAAAYPAAITGGTVIVRFKGPKLRL